MLYLCLYVFDTVTHFFEFTEGTLEVTNFKMFIDTWSKRFLMFEFPLGVSELQSDWELHSNVNS